MKISDQFVTCEIALKLKELGFDETCLGYFDIISKNNGVLILGKDPELLLCQKKMHYIFGQQICLAPLWQQAIDWIRKTYDIIIDLKYSKDILRWNGYNRCYFIINNDIDKYDSRGIYCDTFYEDEKIMKKCAILKSIELIKVYENK